MADEPHGDEIGRIPVTPFEGAPIGAPLEDCTRVRGFFRVDGPTGSGYGFVGEAKVIDGDTVLYHIDGCAGATLHYDHVVSKKRRLK